MRASAQKIAVPGARVGADPIAAAAPGVEDAALVAALIHDEAWARVTLVQRFEPLIERLVAGALGFDPDLADIINDVFVRVFENVHQLKDPAALRGWIASLAVFTARGHIRKRRRWRWIRFFAPEDMPDVAANVATPEQHELLRSAYRVLDTLPADERMAFSLRFIAEMDLTEVAAACGVSLATIKRRLSRADAKFRAGAGEHPALQERLAGPAGGARKGDGAR